MGVTIETVYKATFHDCSGWPVINPDHKLFGLPSYNELNAVYGTEKFFMYDIVPVINGELQFNLLVDPSKLNLDTFTGYVVLLYSQNRGHDLSDFPAFRKEKTEAERLTLQSIQDAYSLYKAQL